MQDQSRQLAAIMFTDIEGYTAMMGNDEENALKVLRINRKIHRSSIEKYGGKLLKEMGDGILAQFTSVLDAVRCALAIQKESGENLNANVRIGIHLGDVTIENEDIFGDGVNIASRLQHIADPGGIYISESVNNVIRSIKDIEVIYLGEIRFKNVKDPVRTFALQGEGIPVPSQKRRKELSGKKKAIPKATLLISFIALLLSAFFIIKMFSGSTEALIDSMAVLPFDNLTGNSEHQLFVDGMHDALIGELGQIGALRVISKTSTLKYRGTQLSIPEIAQELGVDALIEGSVFEVDSAVKIQVKLIRAFPEEKQLWNSSFNRTISSIYDIYREASSEIVDAVKVEISPSERNRLENRKQVNPEAYEAYLKGKSYWDNLSQEGLQTALNYYELSIKKDSTFAPGYGGIASVWAARQQMGYVSSEEAHSIIKAAIERSLQLDSTLAESYYYLGIVNVWTDWEWDAAEIAFKRSLEINPNLAGAHAYYSHLLGILKRPDEGLFHIEKAIELDPYNPLFKVLYGVVSLMTREFDKAIVTLQELENMAPNNPLIQIVLFQAYHHQANFQMAYQKQRRLLELVSEAPVVQAFDSTYQKSGYRQALYTAAETWNDLVNMKFIPPDNMYWLYAASGNKEKTLEWVEIGYEVHDSGIPYIGAIPLVFDLLKDESDYIDLLNRLNLP